MYAMDMAAVASIPAVQVAVHAPPNNPMPMEKTGAATQEALLVVKQEAQRQTDKAKQKKSTKCSHPSCVKEMSDIAKHEKHSVGDDHMAFLAHMDRDSWEFRVGAGWKIEVCIQMQYYVRFPPSAQSISSKSFQTVPDGVEQTVHCLLDGAIKKLQERNEVYSMEVLQAYFGRKETRSKGKVTGALPAGTLWNKAKDSTKFDSELKPARYITSLETAETHIKFLLHTQNKSVLDRVSKVLHILTRSHICSYQ